MNFIAVNPLFNNRKPAKVQIRKSRIHGLGLFACENIARGRFVIEYAGEKLTNKEASRRERFYEKIGYTRLFVLDEKYTLDGLVGGNESSFINHNHKNPNLIVYWEEGKILFYARRAIRKGGELTFDYGFDPA